MRKGTILDNPWVNEKNPLKRSIYMGVKGRYFETWYIHEGKLKKAQYDKSILKEFDVVGYTNVLENFIKDLAFDLEVL